MDRWTIEFNDHSPLGHCTAHQIKDYIGVVKKILGHLPNWGVGCGVSDGAVKSKP